MIVEEMNEVAFTGQPMNNKAEVVCNKCKNGLIGLHWSAWFDPYLPTETYSSGSYVHYLCLSDKRQAEIKAMD